MDSCLVCFHSCLWHLGAGTLVLDGICIIPVLKASSLPATVFAALGNWNLHVAWDVQHFAASGVCF